MSDGIIDWQNTDQTRSGFWFIFYSQGVRIGKRQDPSVIPISHPMKIKVLVLRLDKKIFIPVIIMTRNEKFLQEKTRS